MSPSRQTKTGASQRLDVDLNQS